MKSTQIIRLRIGNAKPIFGEQWVDTFNFKTENVQAEAAEEMINSVAEWWKYKCKLPAEEGRTSDMHKLETSCAREGKGPEVGAKCKGII